MTAPHCPVCESGHIYFTKSGIVCRRCGFDERKKKIEELRSHSAPTTETGTINHSDKEEVIS